MSDLKPFKLIALASRADESLIPPLEQGVIFSRMFGYICELELQLLPEEPFEQLPCASPDLEDVDDGILSKGIDFLGRYEHGASEITVTLNICRITRFSARHGFHPEDVVKIVLLHELAHFVTHLGTASGEHWEDFGKATSEQK